MYWNNNDYKKYICQNIFDGLEMNHIEMKNPAN